MPAPFLQDCPLHEARRIQILRQRVYLLTILSSGSEMLDISRTNVARVICFFLSLTALPFHNSITSPIPIPQLGKLGEREVRYVTRVSSQLLVQGRGTKGRLWDCCPVHLRLSDREDGLGKLLDSKKKGRDLQQNTEDKR